MENTQTRNPRVVVTTSISNDHWNLAKENNIAWNDALEFGIKFLIAERDGFDYPKNKLSEKLEKTIKMLNAKSQECEAIRDQIDNLENERDENDDGSDGEIDEMLNAKGGDDGKE